MTRSRERHLTLEPGQWCADAVVDAGRECEVLDGRRPAHIEALRVGVDGRVPVGGADEGHDPLARPDGDTADLDGLVGDAADPLDRRVEAQCLLDRRTGERRVGAQEVPLPRDSRHGSACHAVRRQRPGPQATLLHPTGPSSQRPTTDTPPPGGVSLSPVRRRKPAPDEPAWAT